MLTRVDRVKRSARTGRILSLRWQAFSCITCLVLLIALPFPAVIPPGQAPDSHLRTADSSIAATASTFQYLFPNGSGLSELGNSTALASMLLNGLGLPSMVLQSPAAQIAHEIAGNINRAPPSAGTFDSFLEGYQLVSFSDGSGDVIELVYSNTGPNNGYILAIDIAFGASKPAPVSQSQYSSHATSVLSSLGAPIDTLSRTSYINQTNYTTIVLSSELGGLGLVGCNLAAFTYADATGQLAEIQLRPFLTLPSQMSLTPDQAMMAGRDAARSKYLDSTDVTTGEHLIGIRFVARTLDAGSPPGQSGNSTTSPTIDIRFGYEYLVNLSSERPGLDYSILAVIDVDSGEELIVVREPVPIETMMVALPLWAVAGVLIAALVVLIALVAISPELAIGLIGCAIAPLYMRLRGAGVLDSFNRGRLFGYITAKPGATFTELKNVFNVGNGNLAYHLSVLERLELVKSRKEGRTRRFFCHGVAVELPNTQFLGRTEARVLDELNRRGPSSNSDLARELGMSRQRTHYNLRLLRGRGLTELMELKWRGTSPSEKAPPELPRTVPVSKG